MAYYELFGALDGTRFNPHHTGDWLEYFLAQQDTQLSIFRFNPHHTGDWLEFKFKLFPLIVIYN